MPSFRTFLGRHPTARRILLRAIVPAVQAILFGLALLPVLLPETVHSISFAHYRVVNRLSR
jgi:hypothetical protein